MQTENLLRIVNLQIQLTEKKFQNPVAGNIRSNNAATAWITEHVPHYNLFKRVDNFYL